MTTLILVDGRAAHILAVPFVTDDAGRIEAPGDALLDEMAAFVPRDRLLLFSKRLVKGSNETRFEDRYVEVNRARLKLAAKCIDRALAELFV